MKMRTTSHSHPISPDVFLSVPCGSSASGMLMQWDQVRAMGQVREGEVRGGASGEGGGNVSGVGWSARVG